MRVELVLKGAVGEAALSLLADHFPVPPVISGIVVCPEASLGSALARLESAGAEVVGVRELPPAREEPTGW
jgi:hypothetical protein